MTKEEILNNKYLKWLKPYASKDWLWKNKKKEIAKGAVGFNHNNRNKILKIN